MNGWRIVLAITIVAACLASAGCVRGTTRTALTVPESARTVEHIIYDKAVWSGEVRVVKPVIVARPAQLIVKPGTTIYFDVPEVEAGADRQPWILVRGHMVALGTPEAPIVFTSVRLAQNELDDMVHVQEAKEAHFRHCVFERGPWALHLHETDVDVFQCQFRDNFGGVRFQGDTVVVRGNRFEDNRIGIRCLRAVPQIEQNEFRDNLTGIFFREGVTDAVLRENNFANLEYDLKLGEAQVADVDAARNWWQAAQRGQLGERIFDGNDSEGIGFVVTAPTLTAPWGVGGEP